MRTEEGKVVMMEREEVRQLRKARRKKAKKKKQQELIGIANREIHLDKAKPQTMICNGTRTASRKEI